MIKFPGYDTLITTADDEIVTITLNRPDRLNAMTATMISELSDVVERVDLDPAVRAVIVTGAGRGFCAGIDLRDAGVPPGAETVRPVAEAFMRQDQIATLNERLHRSRKPWIAAVNGPCVGGGFALALERERSAELLLTARIFDATDAHNYGLIVDVTSVDRVLERAIEIADQVRANPPFGTWMTKETMWQSIDASSFRQAIDLENRTQIMLTATGDMDEATNAFAQRRPPEWKPL